MACFSWIWVVKKVGVYNFVEFCIDIIDDNVDCTEHNDKNAFSTLEIGSIIFVGLWYTACELKVFKNKTRFFLDQVLEEMLRAGCLTICDPKRKVNVLKMSKYYLRYYL